MSPTLIVIGWCIVVLMGLMAGTVVTVCAVILWQDFKDPERHRRIGPAPRSPFDASKGFER